MNVIQLGCGVTGLVCAEELAKNEKVTKLVLADIKTGSANALAKKIHKKKVSVKKIDAADKNALRRLLKGADIVISAVSWTLNRKVMSMAIETGTNYVDFSMSLGYDEALKERNIASDAKITILSCMGSDPGMSNVFAKYAADKLDSVESIRTMDGDTGAAEGLGFYTLWSPTDMMDEASTPPGIFKNGKMTFAEPLSVRSEYEFPAPVGKMAVYNTDHEETFMMSHLIKGVKDVDFRIALDDNFVNIAKVLRVVGMNRRDPINVKGKKIVPLDVLTALMPRPTDFADKVKGHLALVVETTGMKSGKKKMIKIWTTMSHEKAYVLSGMNATGYMVGLAGAIGTEMIIDEEITQKGLVWPEMIPAEKYIKRMREKGLEVHEQITEL